MNTLNATLGPLVSPDELELSYTDVASCAKYWLVCTTRYRRPD
jgi:hypothetical protein